MRRAVRGWIRGGSRFAIPERGLLFRFTERDDLEQCDDGSDVGGDGCEADCTVPPRSTAPCAGERDQVGGVSKTGLRTAVDVALGLASPVASDAFAGEVTVDALVRAVCQRLLGCNEALA